MRKPRDFDTELKALNERAAELKSRKVRQLGELVVATGADTLSVDLLAGALIVANKETDSAVLEGWRKAGAAFFQRPRRPAHEAGARGGSAAPSGGGTLPLDSGKGAA